MLKLNKLDKLDSVEAKLMCLQDKVDGLEKQLAKYESENNELKKTVEEQNKTIVALDKRLRDRSVIIHGFKIEDQLEEEVVSFF